MDLKELFKDVTSFNKEAAMKENMRMGELKDSVIAQAFRDAQIKLASHVNVLKIDSPESNLTEFSRNKLSGKMKAMLSVSTTAGLKRLPIHFVVKASVPTMVETPEQVVAALDNVEGSIDKEVKEILEKQKQHAAYHNESFEEVDNILDSLKKQVENKEITLEQAGEQLFDAGWFNYIPTEEQTKQKLGIKAELKEEITVQAKKKEIDLGVRENTYAEQFPVKLLVYPKTYLPELKKGDILNVGGLKYKYIGDEPTISGDTENGINARFELMVTAKKASLNVEAGRKPEGQESAKKELDEQAKEGFDDLSVDEVIGMMTAYKEYNITPPTELLKQVSGTPQLSAWYMENFADSMDEALEEATPNMVKQVLNSSKYTLEVVNHFADEKTKFESIPQQFKDVLLKDAGALEKLVEDKPNLLSEEAADVLLSNNSFFAEEAVEHYADKYKSAPGFKVFKDWADKQGVEEKKDDTLETPAPEPVEPTPSVEEPVETPVDTPVEETPKPEVETPKIEEKVEETPSEEESIDEKVDDVKKNSNRGVEAKEIEKEADSDSDLRFSTSINSVDVEWDDNEAENIALLKNNVERMKSIPDDWITVRSTDWSYGNIDWSVSIDAGSEGIDDLLIVCYPTKLTCTMEIEYYENAEAADIGDWKKEEFDFDYELKEVDSEIDSTFSNSIQLYPRKVIIYTDNTALVLF